jgi:CheY-like chemotaxis protein
VIKSATSKDRSGPSQPAPSATAQVVLVVEDEPVIRELILEVMQDRGCQCLQAADGNAALAMVRSHANIDLLITDVGLPGLDGRRLAEQAQARIPTLHVLFITGYAEDSIVELVGPGTRMGMLPKPFGVEDLLRAVRGLLPS